MHLKQSDIPSEGQRSLVVGQTGSGKTEFVLWLLERLAFSPIIIYDTKGEVALEKLPRSRLVHTEAAIRDAINDAMLDYIIFRVPPRMLADDDIMDGLLLRHFNEYRGIGCYMDEVFNFTRGGRTGQGLLSLLTQGRLFKITVIMCAQRPSWLSRFCITEAQKFYIFRLVDKKDKARLGDVIPDFADLPNPPPFGFYYYSTNDEAAQLMEAIPLDNSPPIDYKEHQQTAIGSPDTSTSLNWI